MKKYLLNFFRKKQCEHNYIEYIGKRLETDKRYKIEVYKCSNCNKEFKLIAGGY